MEDFKVKDEWYFNMRFREGKEGVTSVLDAVPDDNARSGKSSWPRGPKKHILEASGKSETLCWSVERNDGGRGVGFTGAHFHSNFADDGFRKLVLNAVAWTAGVDIPEKGLSIARMIGHITYLSEESMIQKFGRKLQSKEDYGYNLQTDFQVESYLHYQGSKFVSRFDANSYLYLSKAMSYFDLHKSYGSLENALSKTKARFLVMAIPSDWLYATKESKKIVKVLMKLNKEVTYCEIESPYGHDGFLLSQIQFGNVIGPFLEALSGENADA